MDYQEITVCVDGTLIHVHGDFIHDTVEGTLVVMGEGGSTYTFNWEHVNFFHTAPAGTSDED